VQFTRRLRAGVRRGEITCSVRIWMRPHVKVGGRYPVEGGHIEVDAVLPIELADITPELARASGFAGVIDLLKTAKHGRGENVYLVRFHFLPAASRTPTPTPTPARTRTRTRPTTPARRRARPAVKGRKRTGR
jgi:hypothetical protein